MKMQWGGNVNNFERDNSVDVAINNVKNEFRNINVSYKVSQYGEKYMTTIIELNKVDHANENYRGNGKGFGKQSLASGLFEALEHYLGCPNVTARKVIPKQVSQLYNQDNLNNEYPIKMLYQQNPEFMMDCETFIEYGSNSSEIFYPAFLTHPIYSQKNLNDSKFNLFSTNNGTSVGLNLEEALLHGVNEVIERDSISVHLIQNFISSKKNTIKVVKQDSCPSFLKKLIDECNTTLENLKIIDITSDLSIPTYLVKGDKRGNELPIVGTGSSISAEYALERALLECLQSYYLHDEILEKEDRTNVEKLGKYVPLLNCLLLNYECSEELISLHDYSIEPERLTLKEQLKKINMSLNKNGYKMFFKTIYKSENLFCVKVIVPGLEKFHLVRSGVGLPLSSRGETFL